MTAFVTQPILEGTTPRRRGFVTEYLLHAYCPLCHGFHDTSVRVARSEPFDIVSIQAIYGEGNLPAPIEIATAQQFLCPKTGDWFTQSDLKRLFLITPDAAPKIKLTMVPPTK